MIRMGIPQYLPLSAWLQIRILTESGLGDLTNIITNLLLIRSKGIMQMIPYLIFGKKALSKEFLFLSSMDASI